MKRSNGKDLPKAREKDLVTRQIPGELLVYDLKRHKAFCLNDTAAAVWKGCNGRRDVNELARLLADDRTSPIDEKVVWLALDQLEKSNLLREKVSRPAALPRVSRRDLIRIGVVTAVTLPLVTMIAAPVAAQAGTPITTTVCNARAQPNCGGNPCSNGGPGTTCQPKGGGCGCV
jgi:Coenzyme PQQ synthesis protein D (PqqD)